MRSGVSTGCTARTILAIGLVAGLATGACSPEGQAGRGPAEPRDTPVVVAPVALREFVDRIEALGTARANESLTITARVTDTVSRLDFTDGQPVAAGSILAVLADAQETAELDEAQATLREAQQQYARTRELLDRGTATQARLDEVTTQRDVAAARVAAIEARLADRIIRAPFAGVLGLRMVSPGELVQPGDEITTLDDIDVIKADFSVPERFLSALAPGQRVQARSAAFPGREFTGTVSVVDTRVDPVTRAVTVRARIPNPDHALRPGMLLTVDVFTNRRRSASVPEEAIVPIANEKYVYVIDADSQARRTSVRLGAREPGWVEVTGGLEPGARVIVEGVHRIRDGAPVSLVGERGAPDGAEPDA